MKKNLTHSEMICHICSSPDYEEDNQIVFCSICNISVHQDCYKIDRVPKDDWICQLCLKFGEKGKMLSCPFCKCRGGAMFLTDVKISLDVWQ